MPLLLPPASRRPSPGRQSCKDSWDWQSSADPGEYLICWTTGHFALCKSIQVPFLSARISKEREYSSLPSQAVLSGADATQGSFRCPRLLDKDPAQQPGLQAAASFSILTRTVREGAERTTAAVKLATRLFQAALTYLCH